MFLTDRKNCVRVSVKRDVSAATFVLTSLLSILIFFTVLLPVRAQQINRDFDYNHYPRIDYDVKALSLDLNIDPNPLHLDGVANYRVVPRIDSLKEIQMHAIRLDIQQVQVDGSPSDFTVNEDTLTVKLQELADRGQTINFSVRYRTTPDFGILRDTSGTVWTSRLPRSNAHWVPVFDHPRVEFQADLQYTVPPDYTVLSNGRFEQQEVISVDQKKFHFTTKKPVAATELAFAAGPLVRQKISFGVKTINGYFPKNSLSDKRKNKLLDAAYNTLSMTEDKLQREFPYSSYSFLVLPDHHWETKNYAASVGLLYRNNGSLTAQLQRSIWGQWFGSFQREEQWSDASGILLHQAWVESLFEDNQTSGIGRHGGLDSLSFSFYDVFGGKHWEQWKHFFDRSEYGKMKRVVSRTARNLVSQQGGVFNWDDYARVWYRRSGQPWFSVPLLAEPEARDTSRYRVKTYYNMKKERLAFRFEAIEHSLDELISLPLIQVRGDTTLRKTVTFTGERDSVVFTAPSGLQNVYIENDLAIPLKMHIDKPKDFWIHQLRNAKSSSDRASAALGLKDYREEPDLQLLLNQVLKEDSAAVVRASVYEALAAITRGATGMQETFLSALRSDNPLIQTAALNALTYYKEDENVGRAVRRFALNSTTPVLTEKAVKTYAEISGEESFNSFAKEFASRESAAAGLATVLRYWIKSVDTREPLKIAVNYVSADYNFETRSNMIRLLNRFGSGFDAWLKKIPELLQDLDPRVRYMSVDALSLLPAKEAQSVAEERLAIEYDARVVEKLNTFIQ